MPAADMKGWCRAGERVEVICEGIPCECGLKCIRQAARCGRFDNHRQGTGGFHAAQNFASARADCKHTHIGWFRRDVVGEVKPCAQQYPAYACKRIASGLCGGTDCIKGDIIADGIRKAVFQTVLTTQIAAEHFGGEPPQMRKQRLVDCIAEGWGCSCLALPVRELQRLTPA